MIEAIILVVALIVMAVFAPLANSFSKFDFLGFFMVVLGGVTLVAGVIIFPMHRISNYAEIDAFQATQESYENMREDKRDFESFSIYEDIAGSNRWLARSKRYRSIGFTFMYPEEIEKLEPIR